jgi:hypothetical protein
MFAYLHDSVTSYVFVRDRWFSSKLRSRRLFLKNNADNHGVRGLTPCSQHFNMAQTPRRCVAMRVSLLKGSAKLWVLWMLRLLVFGCWLLLV